MRVIKRVISIPLQIVIGGLIGAYSAYFSWIVFSWIPLIGVFLGLLFGAAITAGLVYGIGRLFALRGDGWWTLIAAGFGVPLSVLAWTVPSVQSLGYGLSPLLEAIPAILATIVFHWTDFRAATLSKA